MTNNRELCSVDYEPSFGESLFARWERDETAAPAAPVAVRSAVYRELIASLLEPHRKAGRQLLSIGAGNGFAETVLQGRGWNVLATDRAKDALTHCRAKGLAVARLDLLSDGPIGRFDALYCDGVLGHLWRRVGATSAAWHALAAHAKPRAVCLVCNDLADDDRAPTLRVRSADSAEFYRPPAGWFAREAIGTECWKLLSQDLHLYERAGEERRRELVMLRSLMNDRIEPDSCE